MFHFLHRTRERQKNRFFFVAAALQFAIDIFFLLYICTVYAKQIYFNCNIGRGGKKEKELEVM